MTKISDLQDRNYLQKLRRDANIMADTVVNEGWVRAYHALADAADTLDAMHARTFVVQSNDRPLSIGIEAGIPKTCGCDAPDCNCDQNSGCCRDRS